MGDSHRLQALSDQRAREWFSARASAFALMALAGLWVSGAGGLRAQAPAAKPTILMEPPAPLLPATLGKLKRLEPGDVGDGIGKLDVAGLSAQDKAVVTEDGLKRFAQSEYGGVTGKDLLPQAKVTVYKFIDASGAIAAYDYFRKPGMQPEKLGDDAVSNGDELLLRSGVNVVRADSKSRESVNALAKELIVGLPKIGGSAGQAPLLPTLLPAKGLDADSERYALGPDGYAAMGGVLPAQIVGFEKSAETVTAKYKNGGVLTLLLYPTPQIAGEYGRVIETAMNQPGAAAAAGTVKLRREGPLLALTTGAWSANAAQAMVEEVHLYTEVSFDKPMPLEFHAEIQKTYSLLESIGLFCGFSAVAMVVLALFFGGGRALIRVMQGKSAASEPEFLRIDLRGPAGKHLGGPKA